MGPGDAGARAPPAAAVILLLLGVTGGVGSARITALRVPAAIRNGTDHVVLDCEYTLRPDEAHGESGLVVKWYFNNGPSPVYQWIPGKRPQDLGALRGKLDLSHRATDHRFGVHRALRILRPTTEHSGEYKCLVSTFAEEDSRAKKMVVYALNDELELRADRTDDGVNITCIARGFFPEPQLTVLQDQEEIPSGVSSRRRSGAYNVIARATVGPHMPLHVARARANEADAPAPSLIECVLKVTELDVALRRSYLYYKGHKPPTNDSAGHSPWRPPLLLSVLPVLLPLFLLAPHLTLARARPRPHSRPAACPAPLCPARPPPRPPRPSAPLAC